MGNEESQNDRPEVLIASRKGWGRIDWGEIWAYRELLLLMARRDVSVIYKQTILGPAWFLIQPILMSLVFAVVFGRMAKIPTMGLPKFIFYMSGLLLWNYFRGVFEGTANAFTNNRQLFTKVYFPRLIAPLSFVLSNLVYLGLNLVVFTGFYAWHVWRGTPLCPTWWLLLAPLLVFYVALTGLGFGLVFAALTAKYRDLKFAMPFILQVWLYSTPIIYPLLGVADRKFQVVLMLNPMAVATEAMRFMLAGRGVVTPAALAVGLAVILAVLALGLGLYNRVQRNFVDTI